MLGSRKVINASTQSANPIKRSWSVLFTGAYAVTDPSGIQIRRHCFSEGMSTQVRAIQAVACFEAFKGVAVLLAASGLLSLINRDLYSVATVLIQHMHLNPASKYPNIFLDFASRMTDSRLLLLAAGAAVYSAMRFIEAYGLFRGRAWAEVVAALSGAIYVPFEIIGLVHAPTWHGVALLVLNLVIVGIMVFALIERRRARDVQAGAVRNHRF